MNTPARPYICTIPEAPPSFNDYNGWPDWKQREKKRQWQSMVLGLVNQEGEQTAMNEVIYSCLGRAVVRAVRGWK